MVQRVIQDDSGECYAAVVGHPTDTGYMGYDDATTLNYETLEEIEETPRQESLETTLENEMDELIGGDHSAGKNRPDYVSVGQSAIIDNQCKAVSINDEEKKIPEIVEDSKKHPAIIELESAKYFNPDVSEEMPRTNEQKFKITELERDRKSVV